MAPRTTIFWFRRDLRLEDNPALLEAVRVGDGDVVATFVIDDAFVRPAGATRVAFLRATLSSLDQSLDGALTVLAGDPAEQLGILADAVRAVDVFATRDFGPLGRSRDDRVLGALATRGIAVHFIDSPYVVAPGTVRTKSGSPCRVFGAFRRGWELELRPEPLSAPEGVRWRQALSSSLDELSIRSGAARPAFFGDLPDGVAPSMILAGEAPAHQHLANFAARVDRYGEERNLPGLDSTSRLSVYVRFGSLHPRQVLAAVDGLSQGRAVFQSQLGWREFYADVLFHRPDSVRRVLQPSFEHLRVDTDARAVERFQTWARGETGFPLVDAGMRQLLREGWMHNRVRMVAASFLVKHLHLDWRWGARWFMWRLIDADLASNQHGWQWTAGTGTDAAPFHRIFNPTLQAQRFDPEGTYVRRYIPELADVPAPQCLNPGAREGLLTPDGYAPAMLDAALERNEALARFAESRELARVGP